MAQVHDTCLEMAGRQDGLFTPAQAYGAGYSERGLRNAIECGRYERELPKVLAVPGCPRSWRRNLRAVVWWGGPEAAASHRSAARMWGLTGFRGDCPEISLVRWKNPTAGRLRDGTVAIVHRVDERLLPEIEEIEGIAVTSTRRTILDLAGIGDPRVEIALDSALVKDLLQLGPLCLLLEQDWMKGRRGVRIARDLILPRVGGLAPMHSDLEVLMQRVVSEYNLPPIVRQHPIDLPFGRVHVDFAYPASRLAIETDSYAWHLNRKAFEADRERDNELRIAGWTVLRFTWAMLKFEPGRVADIIRLALHRECA